MFAEQLIVTFMFDKFTVTNHNCYFPVWLQQHKDIKKYLS